MIRAQRVRALRGTVQMAFGKAKKERAPLTEAELLEYAGKALGSRMRSERDLRRKMRERVEAGEEGWQKIDAVIAKLKELGYLNDERFAADFTRLRQENEKFGRRRVQQGLMQKGIAAGTANEALAKAYDEVDETALARQYVERKRMRKPEGEKEVARAMRRLVGAGFSTRAVWAVLRSWGAEVEEVDVVEGGEG